MKEFLIEHLSKIPSSCCKHAKAAAAAKSAPRAVASVAPRPFESIPGPKPSLPLIGTSWIYFPFIGRYRSVKLHKANIDKYKRYGPIMREEYQKGFHAVTIFDPKDIKELYKAEERCPIRPTPAFVSKHRQNDPSRYPNIGLANMMGEEWFKLRSTLAPILLGKEFKEQHIGGLNQVSTSLVNSSNNNNYQKQHSTSDASGVIDNIQNVFYRYSIESIFTMCINQSLGCLQANNNRNINNQDGEVIFKVALDFFEAQHKLYYGSSLWKYYNTKPFRQLQESLDLIYDIAAKYIDKSLENLKTNDCRTTPITETTTTSTIKTTNSSTTTERPHSSLVETLYEKTNFNLLEIKSTVVDFIGGGIYTMANTLTMTLFLLAANQNVQDKLYKEICELCPPPSSTSSTSSSQISDIDIKTIDNLKFLKCCLKESYRLLPTIPGIARITQRDMVLSNYMVPKGTLVFSNFMVTCRLPQYFDSPDTYNPSRWFRDGSTQSEMAFSVLPFGHGVRKCIGHNFAENEMYVALAKLIKNFKVETVDSNDIDSLDLSYKFIVIPEKPVKLKFTPRNKTSDEINNDD